MRKPWSSRRLALTLALVTLYGLLCVFLLRAWLPEPPRHVSDAAVPTLTAVGHRTYAFTLRYPPLDSPWHAGQRLVLTWVPTFDNFTLSGQARPVRCTVAFYGPFPTEAAAQQEWKGPLSPTVPPWPSTVVPALAPPALLTDDWTSQPQTMAVTLPPTMAPGYYVVLDFETYAGGQSGSGQVVSVTAS